MTDKEMKDNSKKIILDLCGGTGSWSLPYKDAGYDVRVITLPTFDVTDPYVIEQRVALKPYGILAAPPCTEFAVSGARWWKDKDPMLLQKAVEIVYSCLYIIEKTNPAFWALENPVGRLRGIVKQLGKPKLIFNPCDFGDPYTKKTLLWGEFSLLKKSPVKPEFVEFTSKKGEKKRMSKIYWEAFKLPPIQRAEKRSITSQGFAKAFYEANK